MLQVQQDLALVRRRLETALFIERKNRVHDLLRLVDDLHQSCIGRIEQWNPHVNAVVTTCYERARAEARAAETAVMRGDALPPLHGLPVGIKDLDETEGVRTSNNKNSHKSSHREANFGAGGKPGN